MVVSIVFVINIIIFTANIANSLQKKEKENSISVQISKDVIIDIWTEAPRL